MNKGQYSNVQRVYNRGTQVDTHELLKRELYSQGPDSDSGARVTGGSLPTVGVAGPAVGAVAAAPVDKVGFEDYELYLDSTDGINTALAVGEIKWLISPLNNNQDIKNVVQLRIGSFFFPRVTGDAAAPDYFFFRRVFLQLGGLSSTQGYLAANNKRFQFEFEVENINSVAVRLNPIKDTFVFQRPITSFSEILFRFSVPVGFRPIVIPRSVVAVTAVPLSNPAQFDILLGTTEDFGAVGTPTAPGVAIYIQEFVVADATVNVLANRLDGHYVTTINSTTRITIAGLDFSSVAAPQQLTARIIIAKNRIAVPIRLTTVENQVTNSVIVTRT